MWQVGECPRRFRPLTSWCWCVQRARLLHKFRKDDLTTFASRIHATYRASSRKPSIAAAIVKKFDSQARQPRRKRVRTPRRQ